MDPSGSEFSFLRDEGFAEAAIKHRLSISQVQALAVAAVKAKALAYCNYSQFRVGAALLTRTSLPISNIAVAPPPSSSLASSLLPTTSETHGSSSTNTDDSPGQIIVGANIENCSYPVGTCAERAAFATALAMGHIPAGRKLRVPVTMTSDSSSPQAVGNNQQKQQSEMEIEGRGLAAVAVSADTESPCSPCGMCRQFMREFLPPETPIFMVARSGRWDVKTIGELLPMSFGASDLATGQGK